MMNWVASVARKDCRPIRETMTPLATPSPAPTATPAATAAASPASFATKAAATPAKPKIAPTERSNSPAMITTVIPQAISPGSPDCSARFLRFRTVRNASFARAKTRQRTSSATTTP